MASAADKGEVGEVEAGTEATAAPPKKSRMVLIIILLAIVAGAGGGGYWYYLQSQKHAAAAKEKSKPVEAKVVAKAPANYLALQPPFVVNLSDNEAIRYLQTDMEVMSRDPKVLEDVKLHMPRIRYRLLLLLGQQRSFDINTREGKEALQAKVLAEIQQVLTDETGKPGIEAVYFTSFVTQ